MFANSPCIAVPLCAVLLPPGAQEQEGFIRGQASAAGKVSKQGMHDYRRSKAARDVDAIGQVGNGTLGERGVPNTRCSGPALALFALFIWW